MFNIFQQPWTLIIAGTVCLLVVLIFRAIFADKRRPWQLAMPFIIIALALGLDFAVKTDYEKINAVLYSAFNGFETQQAGVIDEVISDDYADAVHGSKGLILAYCRELFKVVPIKKISILSKEITIDESRAVLTAEVVVHFADESEFAKMGKTFLLVKGRLFLEKTNGKKWLVYSSKLLELDRKSVTWQRIK